MAVNNEIRKIIVLKSHRDKSMEKQRREKLELMKVRTARNVLFEVNWAS